MIDSKSIDIMSQGFESLRRLTFAHSSSLSSLSSSSSSPGDLHPRISSSAFIALRSGGDSNAFIQITRHRNRQDLDAAYGAFVTLGRSLHDLDVHFAK